MNTVKMTGITDLAYDNRREMHFENDDYDLTVYTGFINKEDPVDFDIVLGTTVAPKKDGLADFVCFIERVSVVSIPSVGYTRRTMSHYEGKGKSGDPGICAAQIFLDGLDGLIRSKYPGYGVIPQVNDQKDADKRSILAEIDRKKDFYYSSPKEKTLEDAFRESFVIA